MSLGYVETLITSQVDGPTLTAAAAASCIPPAALYTLPANFWRHIGQQVLIEASGRISNVVTTPGTARFDVRFGGTVVFDSLAMNLNIAAKVSVGWWLRILLTCRTLGAAANLMGQGTWASEAVIGCAVPTVGSSGIFLLPYASAPAVGSNFASTTAQQVDLQWTQTAATGSLTTHQYSLISLN
jgi:hypothetical protein